MSLPLNLNLFSRLLNAKDVSGDLDTITKPGFYFVTNPTNVPTTPTNQAHLLVNAANDPDTVMIFQLLAPDDPSQGLWYRANTGIWSEWKHVLTSPQVTRQVTLLLTTAEF